MLLGSTGAGKSASGNTILNRAGNPFEEDFSPEAVTRTCQSEQTEVDGQTITVIDTVGLSDTEVKITEAESQIQEMLRRTHIGIDVFLLVIKLGETFTKNDSKVVKWIRDNFGEKALKHTIVLFTHGDLLHTPVERYLNKCKTLRSVVDQCSGGFHVFNNKKEDRFQVPELLKYINKLRMQNRHWRYTEQDYKKSQDELLQKKCVNRALVGAARGGVLGGVAAVAGVAGASMMGAVAFSVVQAALLGAAAGALLAAAVAGAGGHLLARQYTHR